MTAFTTFDFYEGGSPILVSMPHVGTRVPKSIRSRMTERASQLPDTDWEVDRLYDFLPKLGCSIIRANYSRYVVDLNRQLLGEALYPGQRVTDICPVTLFDGSPVYLSDSLPDSNEVCERVERYWQPYHLKIEQVLANIRHKYGYAILWDAHSIQSVVPALFKGRLADFNWGTADGRSCAEGLGTVVLATVKAGGHYSAVLNGRFKGGYITRAYGDPANNIHAIQLELSQATYMCNEAMHQFDQGKAAILKRTLRVLFDVALSYFV